MQALVTGATGFLGRFLCEALRARGDRVTAVGSRECDLTRDDALDPWSQPEFDAVFHLAAWTQAGDFCLHHPGEQWVVNQRLNTNLLAWWQKCQPQAKLVCIGTSCAYDPALPLAEEHYLEGTPIESLFTYAMTKRMLYVGLRALRQQYGLRYLCLVPSTLYGPGYHTDGRQMHFIFDLIRKILAGRDRGEEVVLWGDGHQRRELVYVEDFVRVALGLADRLDGDLVNVGAGEDYSIRRFAALIAERVGFDREAIRYDESRYVGARSKCLRVDRLRQLLPGERFTSLGTGLDRTIAWFEALAPPGGLSGE